MKVEITKAQLEAIKRITDDCSSYIGGADEEWNRQARHNVKLVDRFLKRNGVEREYK